MNAKQFLLTSLPCLMMLTACGAWAPTAAMVKATAAKYDNPEAGIFAESTQPWYPPEATSVRPSPIIVYPKETPYPTPTSLPEEYRSREFHVNPFVEASVDHLSTFALDVDTASYSMARQYILDGMMPPADSVRPEEFINYFRQDYRLPQDAAFAVYADGAPSPFHGDGVQLLRIGIQGYDVSEEERKPLSLTFVIDSSGSMGDENKLELVQESLRLLVERLRPMDTVGIVAYSTRAWVVLEPTNGGNREAILQAIYSLYPTNSTNVEAGLRLGYQMAWDAYRAEASNRVILCSDGVANEGVVDPGGILEYVRGYTDEGITLTTIGVGMGEYNDTLLEQLADNGDGNYAYVDTLEEARRVFVDDLTSTMQVIARNAKVQVDFNPEVVLRYRLVGYENRSVADRDFRNDSVDAGEIGAGHSATAIYAVQFLPEAEGRIATVQLRWEDPSSRDIREINGNVNTWDLAPSFDRTSARYQLSVVVMQFAEMLRQSPYARNTTFRMLSGYSSRLEELLPEDEDVRELARLVDLSAGFER